MAIGLLGQVAVPARLAAWVGVELRIAAAIDVFPARISAERRTAAIDVLATRIGAERSGAPTDDPARLGH